MIKTVKAVLMTLALTVSLSGQVLAASAQPLPAHVDILKLPEWKVTSSSYGGKLLLSDSPEMVPADGITYQDTVSGPVRLFFHHVNATTTAKKVVVLLENAGDEAANITVYQHGLGGPGYDYLAVGKKAQELYMSSQDLYLVEVPAHGSALLVTGLNDTVVEPNMLVNGIYDFTSDKPVNVKVMMMPVNADVKKFAAEAQVLPKDQQRLRGTFDGRDRMLIPQKVYDAAEDGPMAMTLADNEIDQYLHGVDATDGSEVVNYGNYGVVYRIFLPSEPKGKLSYYLNPRGGEYAGAIGIKYQHNVQPPVGTPADRLFFGQNKITDYAHIGTYEGGQSLWLTFSPPGASNLPVKLLVVPN